MTAMVRADAADVEALASLLADAFRDDAFTSWFVGEASRKRGGLVRFFRTALARLALPHGETYKTADGAGAALWVPPGRWRLGWFEELRLLPTVMGLTGAGRVLSVLSGLEALEKRHPREPHRYLMFVGVAPAVQGRGHGAALLEPVLRQCDEEGVPSYLETANARTVPFYERLGFAVREQFRIPHGGPPMWLMWREADEQVNRA